MMTFPEFTANMHSFLLSKASNWTTTQYNQHCLYYLTLGDKRSQSYSLHDQLVGTPQLVGFTPQNDKCSCYTIWHSLKLANGSTIESGITIDPAADKTTILEQITTFYGQRQAVVDAKLAKIVAKIAKLKCSQNKKILDVMLAAEVEFTSKESGDWHKYRLSCDVSWDVKSPHQIGGGIEVIWTALVQLAAHLTHTYPGLQFTFTTPHTSDTAIPTALEHTENGKQLWTMHHILVFHRDTCNLVLVFDRERTFEAVKPTWIDECVTCGSKGVDDYVDKLIEHARNRYLEALRHYNRQEGRR